MREREERARGCEPRERVVKDAPRAPIRRNDTVNQLTVSARAADARRLCIRGVGGLNARGHSMVAPARGASSDVRRAWRRAKSAASSAMRRLGRTWGWSSSSSSASPGSSTRVVVFGDGDEAGENASRAETPRGARGGCLPSMRAVSRLAGFAQGETRGANATRRAGRRYADRAPRGHASHGRLPKTPARRVGERLPVTPTTVATARALARGEREPLDRAERLAALATRGGVLAPGRLPETPAARTLTTTREGDEADGSAARVLQNASSTDATPTRARTTTSKPTPTPRHARTNASSANETPPRPRVTADGSPRMTSRRRRPRRRRPPRPTGAAEPRPRRRRSDDSPRRPRRRLLGEYSTPIRRRGRRGRIERCEARKGSTVSRFPKSRSRHRRRRLACRDPCVPRRRAPRRNRSTAARERDRRLLARHSTASARRSPSRKRARRAVERSERSSRRLVSRRRVPRDAPPKEDASEEDGPPTRRPRRRNRRGWNVSTRSRAARARDSTRSPAAETYRRRIPSR